MQTLIKETTIRNDIKYHVTWFPCLVRDVLKLEVVFFSQQIIVKENI